MSGSTQGPEGKLKSKVRQWITEHYRRTEIICRAFHAPTFRGRPVGETGWPDHEYFVRPRYIFFIEYKNPGEEPTPTQKNRHDELRDLGFSVYVTDDFDEAITIIQREIKKAKKPCS